MKTEIITIKIKLITGLHIGTGKESGKIGGIDGAVIKNPLTDEPYIPASSLKGKLRCLLETHCPEIENESKPNVTNCDVCSCGGCYVCKYFGCAAGSENLQNSNNKSITRFLFRDLEMTEYWKEQLKEYRENGKKFLEEKTEIVINRKTGEAKNGGLRTNERVPAGVEFEGEIVVRLLKDETKEQAETLLKKALEYLKSDALGGSGSRGYGQVKVTINPPKKEDKKNENQ